MKRNILLTAIMLGLCGQLHSATPTLMNYQGRLTTAGGSAVPDANYSVVFTIYDAASGGAIIWTETQSVTTSGGLFAVLLGAVNPADPISDDVFNGAVRYLGVKVGTDPELTPRARLTTVPYAHRVSTVDGSTGGSIGGNINLENTSATSGLLLKGGTRFLHNFGADNTFLGENSGNLAMTGFQNTAIGSLGFQNNVGGSSNTATGYKALYTNTSGTGNSATGNGALSNNSQGNQNAAFGYLALLSNSTGNSNTACGSSALQSNSTGSQNTAIGAYANVFGALTNATVIGYNAIVDASNKIRLGNTSVTVIEGQVAYTFTSDRNQKENFRPVDGDEVLRKIRGFSMTSWNYKFDSTGRRHYGPMAQDFYAAFGHDAVGQIGDSVTINSGDEAGILMIAVQTLEREKEQLKAKVETIQTENAGLKTRLANVEAALNKLISQ